MGINTLGLLNRTHLCSAPVGLGPKYLNARALLLLYRTALFFPGLKNQCRMEKKKMFLLIHLRLHANSASEYYKLGFRHLLIQFVSKNVK